MTLVVTGPSGVGKSSVIHAVLRVEPDLRFSISHTTRPPRAEERDGIDYHFVERQAFERLRDAGGFLESAEVHGNLYGTAVSEIEAAAREGKDLLLDIDVQGAAQVAARVHDAVSIFVLPPDFTTLESRLRGRHSDSEEVIRGRLAKATDEVRRCGSFGYLVVNRTVELAVSEVRSILAAERLRTSRRGDLLAGILGTFPEQGSGAPR